MKTIIHALKTAYLYAGMGYVRAQKGMYSTLRDTGAPQIAPPHAVTISAKIENGLG
jgi:hypothetical protein